MGDAIKYSYSKFQLFCGGSLKSFSIGRSTIFQLLRGQLHTKKGQFRCRHPRKKHNTLVQKIEKMTVLAHIPSTIVLLKNKIENILSTAAGSLLN